MNNQYFYVDVTISPFHNIDACLDCLSSWKRSLESGGQQNAGCES